MYSIGDKIIYGSDGAYVVADFTSSPVNKNDERKFYVLHPVHGPQGNVIITPVGNENVKIRPVMSREDALALIDRIPSILPLTVEKEKNRRNVYKEALADASCEQLVSIVKTVMARREAFINQKKRLSESDNDYERKAKYCLCGELAIALDIPLEEVDEFIRKRVSALIEA